MQCRRGAWGIAAAQIQTSAAALQELPPPYPVAGAPLALLYQALPRLREDDSDDDEEEEQEKEDATQSTQMDTEGSGQQGHPAAAAGGLPAAQAQAELRAPPQALDPCPAVPVPLVAPYLPAHARVRDVLTGAAAEVRSCGLCGHTIGTWCRHACAWRESRVRGGVAEPRRRC